jgi:16S rRNA (cytosine967-C5)-methyltransferase
MITARTLAYQILLQLDRSPAHPDRLIRAAIDRHAGLDPRDRALLTELVYGVLRWQGRLDWYIDTLADMKPSKIDAAVRILLRLALYQVTLLDRVPAHAAVNEAVKTAKAALPRHVVGFVNALLREAVRRHPDWDFPSARENPVRHLAVTTAHPEWLVRHLLAEWGPEETRAFCHASNTVAPLVLRVNPLKASVEKVLARLHNEGIEARPSPLLENAVRVRSPRMDITQTETHKLGWIQIQDEASQLVSLAVGPKPGERVLDLCAGFGGKTAHLAALMENRGEIVSVDQAAWKLEDLRRNIERQGIAMVRTIAADALALSPSDTGLFDRVLLDAPCTGFGVLRRNPDIKWRRHPKDPHRFSRTQKALLRQAARFVKRGGTLTYATCTVFAAENEDVAEDFTASQTGWIPEPAAAKLPETCRNMAEGPHLKTLPHRHDVDGFFIACWRNIEDIP